jgi:hypothetical protein
MVAPVHSISTKRTVLPFGHVRERLRARYAVARLGCCGGESAAGAVCYSQMQAVQCALRALSPSLDTHTEH